MICTCVTRATGPRHVYLGPVGGGAECRIGEERATDLTLADVVSRVYSETDAQLDLVPVGAITVNGAADFPHFEPVEVADGLGGSGNGAVNGLLYALAGRSYQLDYLVSAASCHVSLR
jgi:hypothetical protein